MLLLSKQPCSHVSYGSSAEDQCAASRCLCKPVKDANLRETAMSAFKQIRTALVYLWGNVCLCWCPLCAGAAWKRVTVSPCLPECGQRVLFFTSVMAKPAHRLSAVHSRGWAGVGTLPKYSSPSCWILPSTPNPYLSPPNLTAWASWGDAQPGDSPQHVAFSLHKACVLDMFRWLLWSS